MKRKEFIGKLSHYERGETLAGKTAMFVDMPDGGVKQVGYVITGKAEFGKGDYSGWSTQYIDLWVTILTVVDTVF